MIFPDCENNNHNNCTRTHLGPMRVMCSCNCHINSKSSTPVYRTTIMVEYTADNDAIAENMIGKISSAFAPDYKIISINTEKM